MKDENTFEVIIIGGSYAGLSAAMALGRSLRKVLIIDSGKPCNRQTPQSHNFITHDGEAPKEIADKAKEQVLKYDTVKFHHGIATEGIQKENNFEIRTEKGNTFIAKKMLFATGITDIPGIKGFAECWGISVLHCPYCHGYEVKHENTGVIGNGDIGFEFVRLISNWTKQLTLFTSGKSTLTAEQSQKLKNHNIKIIETEIMELEQSSGNIQGIVFKDKTKFKVKALFARPDFKQHCSIPQNLGCEITEQGYIKVDDFQKTTVHGIYAAGDNSSIFRAVSAAVASGNKAGALINKELIEEQF
jgi:thioredoxin reductase